MRKPKSIVDKRTLANVNLFAILRNLEDLLNLDAEAVEILGDKSLNLKISVFKGPTGSLHFSEGKCVFQPSRDNPDAIFFFRSLHHFNQLTQKKAMPILLKGFTSIPFLLNQFKKMTDLLDKYLHPTVTDLQDERLMRTNTILTFFTVFYAMVEVANSDPVGRKVAARIPDSVIHIYIEDGAEAAVTVTAHEGTLSIEKGLHHKADAILNFSSFSSANQLLLQLKDHHVSLVEGGVRLFGHLGILDELNCLLYRLPFYVDEEYEGKPEPA